MTDDEVKEFNSAKTLIGYKPGAAEPTVFDEVEGRVIHYRNEHKPTTSVLEILRNYEGVMHAKGFEPIVAGRGTSFRHWA